MMRSGRQRARARARARGRWLVALASSVVLFSGCSRDVPDENASERQDISQALAARVARLVEVEAKALDVHWGTEIEADQYGREVEALWDRFNRAPDRLKEAAGWDLGVVDFGTWAPVDEQLSLGVTRWRSQSSLGETHSGDWAHWAQGLRAKGWEADSVEFRHVGFEPERGGQAARSEFYFLGTFTNPQTQVRAIVEGPIRVTWRGGEQSERVFAGVVLNQLEVRARQGAVPFRLALEERIAPPENAHSIDPLIVEDLDGDDRMELLLVGKNLVFRDRTGTGYQAEPLCAFPPRLISTAGIVDLDGDGTLDLVCQKHEGLVCLPGSAAGQFDSPERPLWTTPTPLKYPMVLSFGDMDGDGDVDIFLGQYRVPYEGGSLPTPYYDANDGYPFYCLRQEEGLRFVDVTEDVGLGARRHRRVYSASWVELDHQPGLDLVVVSDFAGIDLYRHSLPVGLVPMKLPELSDPLGFGMAHTISDFNRDGWPDILMIGMTSPTVERLDRAGHWRSGLGDERTTRSRMTAGNRLLVADGAGGYRQDGLSQSIARSGWSWGVSGADFDSDGYPDVYIANGLESRETVRDYERHYWLHDAFVADATNDPAAYQYFKEKFARTRGRGQSYGGYEHNRLYWNQGGQAFVEIGHLMGVCLQEDSRNVVATDLDGDGRMDLVLVSFEPWPESRQVLRVFVNEMPGENHWIGLRFPSQAGSPTAMGVQVQLLQGDRRAVSQIVSGDSYRSQHPATVHFGLGPTEDPVRLTIRWADGHRQEIDPSGVDRYETVVRVSE